MRIKRIIFVGTSEFGLPSLRKLAACKDYEIALVISQPDRPQGRKLQLGPSPVSAMAIELGLPLARPEIISTPEFAARLTALQADIIITASYGGMLGKAIRQAAPLGAINLHPSLLPKHRGASPIQESLRQGDSFTGISIFQLTARMDAGPILLQKSCNISNENYGELHDKLAIEASEMLLDLLAQMQVGDITPEIQNDAEASYCHKIEKQDRLINWQQNAASIACLIRSLAPSPGAFQYLDGQVLKFIEAEATDEVATGIPGTVQQVLKNIGFTINTGGNQLLIKLVQPAGKKIMSSWAFTLGTRIESGTKIWK